MTVSPPQPLRVPDLGEIHAGLRVAQWLCEPGSPVAPGDRLLELLVDGVLVHIACECEGILSRIEQPSGSAVHVGTVLAWINLSDRN